MLLHTMPGGVPAAALAGGVVSAGSPVSPGLPLARSAAGPGEPGLAVGPRVAALVETGANLASARRRRGNLVQTAVPGQNRKSGGGGSP